MRRVELSDRNRGAVNDLEELQKTLERESIGNVHRFKVSSIQNRNYLGSKGLPDAAAVLQKDDGKDQ